MRPEDETVMRVLDSPLIEKAKGAEEKDEVYTSAEWVARKFAALRAKSQGGQNEQVLTGRTMIPVN